MTATEAPTRELSYVLAVEDVLAVEEVFRQALEKRWVPNAERIWAEIRKTPGR